MSLFAGPEVWADGPWLIVCRGGDLFSRPFGSAETCCAAALRLQQGEEVSAVLGWTARRLPLDRVRSVEWVPAAAVLLVRGGWWREPWRVPFSDRDLGLQLFHHLGELVSGGGPAETARVGPG